MHISINFVGTVWLLLILCLGVSHCEGKKKSKGTTTSSTSDDDGSEEGALRRAATVARKIPVASLSDRNFTTYTKDRPRNYHAFIMFTATNPQYQCSICGRAKQRFVEAAQLYHDQYSFTDVDAKKRLAFFTLEVDDARMLFQEMKMDSVPHLYLLPPTTKHSPKMMLSDFEVPTHALLEGLPQLLGEIESATAIKIEAQVSPLPTLVALGLVAALVALFVSAAQLDFLSAVFVYQSPQLWVLVSMVCFGVGVSGSIFCIIRSAQPFGMTRMGLMLFSMGGRDQFLIEGIIVALWTLGCGLAAYGIMLTPKALRRFPLLQHAVVLLCAAVWLVLAVHIWEAYRQKTMWYTLQETLPGELWTWMTASVKKSSSLVKRLHRLSELWLTSDCLHSKTDWVAFQKKFKLLLVDYIMRIVSMKK